MAGYAIQGFSPGRKAQGAPYGGRFFSAFDEKLAGQYSAAIAEWESRKETDLSGFWPTSEVPYGFMTHMNNGGIPNHGFTHWWTMFNPRQLLVLAQLMKAIVGVGEYRWSAREYILGAFQQYLRNQNMFCFWDIGYDKLVPHMSNNNYHPKSNIIENSVFSALGRGNWISCSEIIIEGEEWTKNPWEPASVETLARLHPELAKAVSGKSEKVFPSDPVRGATVLQCSSTELTHYQDSSIDLVITDPPFGGLLHYSELADFFHVWMRLPLKGKYPEIFGPEYTPKAMEAVANKAREPEDPDGFYQRLLTACWKEAYRILKPGGMLAFTFHHSEDAPWVSVLESLFDSGFYLEATYPIRSDETKGEGSKPGTFGSQQIEYDIIHVCRKRTEESTSVSWGRMRREVLADVRQIQGMLENHARAGLPAADLQVIRRGKALEYFSRHYGKVYVDEGRAISVKVTAHPRFTRY
jgi:adenine-specific DNA methylase